MACDPNFLNDLLLLHLDGTNGQSTTVDSSGFANPVTLFNGATIETGTVMFGTGAVNLGDFAAQRALYVPMTAALDLSVYAEWTIEGWFNFPNNFNGQFATFGNLIGSGATFSAGVQFQTNGAGSFNPKIQTPGGLVVLLAAFSTGAWHHFAVVKSSAGSTDVFSAYIDGVLASTQSMPTGAYSSLTGGYTIGTNGWDQSPGYISGSPPFYMDEVRVSNIARYTANFTPAGPFGGVCTTTVPNVVGNALAIAEALIIAASLTVGTITFVSSTLPSGTVTAQSPTGGTVVTAGSPVNLTVSSQTQFVYGKFAGAKVFPPTLLIDAKGIKPRIYMPHENTTVKT
jgi:hypothetical protein